MKHELVNDTTSVLCNEHEFPIYPGPIERHLNWKFSDNHNKYNVSANH